MKTIWRRITGKRVELTVKAKNFSYWPFTVDKGVLTCDVRERCIVTFTARGKTYALNGAALRVAEENGWADDVREIQRRDETFGNLMPLGPIIQHALARAGWDS